MPEHIDIHWSANKHYAQLTMLDPKSGAPMTFCSPMRVNSDGSFAFDVENPATGQKYRITAKVEELVG